MILIIGINTTTDILRLLYVILRAVRQVKFETILKYHKWYLCQIVKIKKKIVNCLFTHKAPTVVGVHMNWFKRVGVFQIELEFGSVGF